MQSGISNKEFSVKLEKRTLDFAVKVIRFCGILSVKIEFNVIKNQLVKSAPSMGANYREANRSESRAEFKHKISIGTKEASETQCCWKLSVNSQKTLPNFHIY